MPVDKAAQRDAYVHIDYEEVYNIVHMGLRYSSLSIFSLVYVSQKRKCCNFAGGLLSYVKTSVCLPTKKMKIRTFLHPLANCPASIPLIASP